MDIKEQDVNIHSGIKSTKSRFKNISVQVHTPLMTTTLYATSCCKRHKQWVSLDLLHLGEMEVGLC